MNKNLLKIQKDLLKELKTNYLNQVEYVKADISKC